MFSSKRAHFVHFKTDSTAAAARDQWIKNGGETDDFVIGDETVIICPPNFKYFSARSYLLNQGVENVDSKVIIRSPFVNECLKKKKLLAFNDFNILAKRKIVRKDVQSEKENVKRAKAEMIVSSSSQPSVLSASCSLPLPSSQQPLSMSTTLSSSNTSLATNSFLSSPEQNRFLRPHSPDLSRSESNDEGENRVLRPHSPDLSRCESNIVVSPAPVDYDSQKFGISHARTPNLPTGVKLSYDPSKEMSPANHCDACRNSEFSSRFWILFPRLSGNDQDTQRSSASVQQQVDDNSEDETDPRFPQNRNYHITKNLERAVAHYQALNNSAKTLAYRKAIAALIGLDFKVTDASQINDTPSIGTRMKEHISEILTLGTLTEIDRAARDDELQAQQLFIKINGVGAIHAEKLAKQGLRQLDEIVPELHLVNVQQRRGLKYFNDLQKKLSRKEVEDIASFIRNELLQNMKSMRGEGDVHPSMLLMEVVGSYRRGRNEIGDVDIVFACKTVPGLELLQRTVASLEKKGNMPEKGISHRRPKFGGREWYSCIFRLRDDLPVHHLDLISCPVEEFALTVFGWTGSTTFERSIHLWAKAHNMQINNNGLRIVNQRDSQGRELPQTDVLVNSEEDIFHVLGLPYVSPADRNV